MNKPLLSLAAAATILGSGLSADTMYDRFEAMEAKMQQMQKELDALRGTKGAVASQDAEDEGDEDEAPAKTAAADDAEDEEDDDKESVEDQIAEIQENITELNKATNGNHLKFGVDYRFAIDNLNYKMADGSEQKNDALLTNRLWIDMSWAASRKLSFNGQLAYNKAYGQRSGWGSNNVSMETFDWITNENAYDDTLRVKSAYFLYVDDNFFGVNMPWTFSIGRRPSTNGHLVNLRDDDHAASPMGHTINVEFDGLSAKFGLEDLTGVSGMYVKFCAGRGGTNAAPKFFATDVNGTVQPSTPYSTKEGDLGNIDLAGLIFRVYNNGQYTFDTQFYYANNLIDADINGSNVMSGMKTVGGLYSATANFMVNGIGNGVNDFLDDTIFFVSGAMSQTDPNKDQGMLGSNPGESKTGYSYWVGLQTPSLITTDGRFGLEYNHGTKYWRSITYGEDTNIGSKLAARGDAYEVYFTEYLVEDILSLQVRYTYIDYDYTGSNGFFGNNTGTPMKISELTGNAAAATVDKAQDIRFYLRYRY